MNDPGGTRVAVYIDFDNIVISRYDQVHGRGQFQRDKVRGFTRTDRSADPDIAEKLRRATVDIGAVIDFASVSNSPPGASTVLLRSVAVCFA